jgi:quinolinate synthase
MYLLSTGDLPADRTFVLGTGGMVERARTSNAKEFIVATETGMMHRLRKENPAAEYIPANRKAECGFMKMITPGKLLHCLETGRDEVLVDKTTADRARVAIERMISIA